jgi:hypothetical protein
MSFFYTAGGPSAWLVHRDDYLEKENRPSHKKVVFTYEIQVAPSYFYSKIGGRDRGVKIVVLLPAAACYMIPALADTHGCTIPFSITSLWAGMINLGLMCCYVWDVKIPDSVECFQILFVIIRNKLDSWMMLQACFSDKLFQRTVH